MEQFVCPSQDGGGGVVPQLSFHLGCTLHAVKCIGHKGIVHSALRDVNICVTQFPYAPFQPINLTSPSRKQPRSNFSHYSLVLSSLVLLVRAILCFAFNFFYPACLRLMYVDVCSSTLFLFIAELHAAVCINHRWFIHSFVDRHLCYFQIWAIWNQSIVTILLLLVFFFFCRYTIPFLIETLRSRICP